MIIGYIITLKSIFGQDKLQIRAISACVSWKKNACSIGKKAEIWVCRQQWGLTSFQLWPQLCSSPPQHTYCRGVCDVWQNCHRYQARVARIHWLWKERWPWQGNRGGEGEGREMRWVFIGMMADPGGETAAWQWWSRSDRKTPPSCTPQPKLVSLLFLQCLVSGSILAQAKEHWYCICAHGSTPQPPQLCRTLDAHHRSARSGSQGIKSSCSSAALMHTPAPGHACTLKGCHFSTHHLSSKSWTVKSIRVLQVIVLPDIHELSS